MLYSHFLNPFYLFSFGLQLYSVIPSRRIEDIQQYLFFHSFLFFRWNASRFYITNISTSILFIAFFSLRIIFLLLPVCWNNEVKIRQVILHIKKAFKAMLTTPGLTCVHRCTYVIRVGKSCVYVWIQSNCLYRTDQWRR